MFPRPQWWLPGQQPTPTSLARAPRAGETEEVIKVLIAIASIVGSTILRGFTLAVMWGWFIAGPEAPFKGLPQLSIVGALSVSMVVSFLTYHAQVDNRPARYGRKSFGELATEGIFTEFIYIGLI